MTPEEFNALPLAKQVTALLPGDELHLRGGGWLPFSGYNQIGNIKFSSSVAVAWCLDGQIFKTDDALDIIRVHRPTAQAADASELKAWREFASRIQRMAEHSACDQKLFNGEGLAGEDIDVTFRMKGTFGVVDDVLPYIRAIKRAAIAAAKDGAA